ncbi:hypothetical protein GCM10009608_39730 [Pseudonocardia alaniniphila]
MDPDERAALRTAGRPCGLMITRSDPATADDTANRPQTLIMEPKITRRGPTTADNTATRPQKLIMKGLRGSRSNKRHGRRQK